MPEAPDRSSVSAPDPLTALRATDARPLTEQWRDRAYVWWADRRIDPRLLVGLVIVAAALLVGPQLVRAGDPPIEDSLPLARASPTTIAVAAPAEPAATDDAVAAAPAVVVVHVAGAVKNPGIVVGADGWRVADAIAAAGGTSPGADLNRVNLAAPIADGERLFVPEVDEEPPTVVTGTGATATAGRPTEAQPVDVNAAGPGELERLPGVGPVTAAAIVAHRDAHGSFGSVDALVAVRGIGPATVEALRDHAVVG